MGRRSRGHEACAVFLPALCRLECAGGVVGPFLMEIDPDRFADSFLTEIAGEDVGGVALDGYAVLGDADGARGASRHGNLLANLASDWVVRIEQVLRPIDRSTRIPR